MQKSQLIKKTIILAFILGIYYSKICVADWPTTDKDFALLPPYCKALIDPETKKRDYGLWAKRVGPGFGNAHHFCAGLHSYRVLNKAYNATASEKKFALIQIINEIEYYETHTGPIKSRIYPAVYLLKAQVYGDMGNTSSAIEYFNKSIDANKEYTNAYVALADFYLKVNSKEQAIETIKTGLQYKPNSITLNRRLKKLQGN